jgi:phospholipid-binding lipoprotein MlaA
MMRNTLHWLAWGALAVLLQGCATVSNPNPRDPWEPMNRTVFDFNDAVDRAVFKPVAQAYKASLPAWSRTGISNFFGNLDDMWSAVNNALALRRQAFGDSVGRVMVNTTLGLGGLIDVASDLNIERHPASFGITLGRWGVGTGPYVVLPLLGPSNVRGVAALPLDQRGNLVNHIADEGTRTGLTVLGIVDTRASFLEAEGVISGAALDRYSFIRDGYLQRQRSQVYDGDPPDEDPPEP